MQLYFQIVQSQLACRRPVNKASKWALDYNKGSQQKVSNTNVCQMLFWKITLGRKQGHCLPLAVMNRSAAKNNFHSREGLVQVINCISLFVRCASNHEHNNFLRPSKVIILNTIRLTGWSLMALQSYRVCMYLKLLLLTRLLVALFYPSISQS